MLSCEESAHAFLEVAEKSRDMQRRWLPDEDWIRKMKDSKECDTTTERLNRGMNTHFCPVDGIYRDSESGLRIASCRITVNTTKYTGKRATVVFYYIEKDPSKKDPELLKGEEGQSIWDDPKERRSKRRLKRARPAPKPKDDEAPTPAQQQKKKCHRAITPSPHDSQESEETFDSIENIKSPIPKEVPTPPAPPTDFRGAFNMIQRAWRVQYPHLHFPLEYITCVPSHADGSVPAHEAPPSPTSAPPEESDERIQKLDSGQWEIIHMRTLKKFSHSHVIAMSLQALLKKQKNHSTPHT